MDRKHAPQTVDPAPSHRSHHADKTNVENIAQRREYLGVCLGMLKRQGCGRLQSARGHRSGKLKLSQVARYM